MVAPLSVPLSRVQAVALGGYLYVAGGVIDPNNEFIPWMQRYSPLLDDWQQVIYYGHPRLSFLHHTYLCAH